MAVYKRGRVWWYKFNWNGEPIRESTKQTNKRVAEQIEAAKRMALAKGEVGIKRKASESHACRFRAEVHGRDRDHLRGEAGYRRVLQGEASPADRGSPTLWRAPGHDRRGRDRWLQAAADPAAFPV
jgi:hypothetical protein